jgi:hypothetical protein
VSQPLTPFPSPSQSALRRLSRQLTRLLPPAPTLADKRASGKWADWGDVLATVRGGADALLLKLDAPLPPRTAAVAMRVQHLLLACIALLDAPPNRPDCLRTVLLPGAASGCDCGSRGCPGNHWAGTSLVLVHHKTQRSRKPIVLDFPAGTATSRLLGHYCDWARALLLPPALPPHPFLFVTKSGAPFETSAPFRHLLPRLLRRLSPELGSLTMTTVRRPLRRALRPAAAGLASFAVLFPRRLTRAACAAAAHRHHERVGVGEQGGAVRRGWHGAAAASR